jgi:hypothetical protein
MCGAWGAAKCAPACGAAKCAAPCAPSCAALGAEAKANATPDAAARLATALRTREFILVLSGFMNCLPFKAPGGNLAANSLQKTALRTIPFSY